MFLRFRRDITRYWNYAIYSAKSQLKAEVADSYLNWLWWILEPLCFMFIYAIVFGGIFNSAEDYFLVFIFTGITMWDFFNRNIVQSVNLIRKNKPIVSKVYLPKYILLISRIMVNAFKMMVSFGIIILMLIFFRVPLSWNVLYAIPVLIDMVLLVFGLGCFLMHFGVFIDDLAYVSNIALRLLFYLSGVFWDIMKRLQAPYNFYVSRYNPIAFLLSSMRDSILYSRVPSRKFLLAYFVIGLVLSIAGIWTIYKNENTYVKVI